MDHLDVNSCRICFSTNASVNLFDNTIELNAAALVESVTNIKIQPSKHISNLICPNCLDKINLSIKLKNDVVHAEDQWKKFIVCGSVFKQKEDLKKEMKHIELVERDGACLEENDDTQGDQDYYKDVEVESKVEDNEVQVEEQLKKRIKHKPEVKGRTCDECGKVFRRHANLLNHIRTHTGEKPFECDVCFKRFSQSGNLIIHQRNHKNWKPYICEICSKQFTQSGNLQQHMFTHKPNRDLKCPECSKLFRHKTSLKRHLITHSGVKNHICSSCDKSFFLINMLKTHIRRVHYNEKRHVCTVCNKAFSNTSNLQVHFRIHTGEKPFECKYCDSKFNQSTPLVRHMRQHLRNNDELKLSTSSKQNKND